MRPHSATENPRVVAGIPFVEQLARRVAATMPHSIDIGDLVQDGVLGLIDAAKRFDEGRGIKFETFAERRVRGAMIDALRKDAWPRGVRRQRREIEAAREELRREHGCEPSLADLAAKIGSDEKRLGRTIGTYPEMKHPSYFAGLGLPMEQRLADALKAYDLDSKSAPVFVQCFEVGPLKTIGVMTKARRVMLVGSGAAPVDVKSAAGIKAIAAFAEGLGPEWPLVIPTVDGGLGAATSLVADAHAAGLAVHPWTVRAENAFLPAKLRRGAAPAEHGDVDAVYKALFGARIDGLFSDFPALAVKARG